MKENESLGESVYDTIFNFIFGVQKEQKEKPFPKEFEGSSDYTSALIEVGTQPLVFPLESTFEKINKNIAKATEIDIGGGVSAGLGSGALFNPNRYSKAEILKNRSKANWASIGGALHHGIDSALVSLYAKSNGASSMTAAEIGRILRTLMKEQLYSGYKYSTHRVFGSDFLSKEEKQEKLARLSILEAQQEAKNTQKGLFSRSLNLRANMIVQRYPQISKKRLILLIKELQKETSKEIRIEKTKENFRTQELRAEELEDVAQMIWGKREDSSLGLYLIEEDRLIKRFEEIRENLNINVSEIKKIEEYRKIEDINERERKIYTILEKKENINPQKALEVSKEIASIKINTGAQIAKDSVYWALATSITEKLQKEGREVSASIIKDKVEEILQPKSRITLGMKAERALLLGRWLSDTGTWGQILVDGDWEKFGVEDINFTKLVERVDAKKDGKVIGSYYVGADSVIGKILGNFYYLHPNNLIKGLFIDGSLWLKWASDRNGNVNTESFAYLMSRLCLKNSLSFIIKPIQGFTNNILKIVNPIFDWMKGSIKKLLTRIIGATGIGGVIVNLLMSVVSDKFAYIINQIVLAFILAIGGILFVIFDGMGVFYSNYYANSVVENSSKRDEIVLGNTFTDEDFQISNTAD